MIYASDSYFGGHTITPFIPAADALFREGQRYVCHFQLDPVSAEAAQLTALTRTYKEDLKLQMHFHVTSLEKHNGERK